MLLIKVIAYFKNKVIQKFLQIYLDIISFLFINMREFINNFLKFFNLNSQLSICKNFMERTTVAHLGYLKL